MVLNGASSSGKTTLAQALQASLPGLWLRFGIDDLLEALPSGLLSGDGISFGSDGSVTVGAAFRQAERAWMLGLAATVRAGASVIVDDVFLSGAASQQRWIEALGDLPCWWVRVHCDPDEAERREGERPDRPAGMHRQQAEVVHSGVKYDFEVNTTYQTPGVLAAQVSAALEHRNASPAPGL